MKYTKEYFLLAVFIISSFWGCKDDLINELPSEGFWTNISPMNQTRWQPQAVLLSNSLVLVTGGNLYEGGIRYSCEIFNPQTNSWSFTDSLPQYVNSHLILLNNGDVLSLASGGAIGGQCLIYNNSTQKWSYTNSFSVRRNELSVTRLLNGKVLVAGGRNIEIQKTCELYDPNTGDWLPTGSMNDERAGHEAVLLQDGKVLVIGGYGKDLSFLRSTEVYDPNSETWSITDSMKYSRVRHSATLLENGTVLVAGGISYSDSTKMEIDIADCEIYNPQTGKWTETNPMIEASSFHSATKIKNNKILVTKNWTSFCQIYDGNSGLWKKTGSLNIARLGYEQLLLSDGRVLVVGGLKFTGSTYITISDAEIFNP